MAYFPMCVDLTERLVLLVGSGPQIREKEERLRPFGARVLRADVLDEGMLLKRPAFVVAGDLDEREAERAAALCAAHGVPVNVVDKPRLCTFSFPAMIVDGDVTVSVSTGGKAPGASACLKRRIAACMPDNAGALVNWLADVREALGRTHAPQMRARLMREITASAFDRQAPLTAQELSERLVGRAQERE